MSNYSAECRLTDSTAIAGFQTDRGELRNDPESETEHPFIGLKSLEKWAHLSSNYMNWVSI
jgi:hypothetical protein